MVPKAYELLDIIKNSKRYKNLKIKNFVRIKDDTTQFGAATFILDDKKIVSFKGKNVIERIKLLLEEFIYYIKKPITIK